MEAVTSLRLKAVILLLKMSVIALQELLTLHISKLHEYVIDEVILMIFFGVAGVKVIITASPFAGRLCPRLFLAQPRNIGRPLHVLQQSRIVEVEDAVVVEFDLEVLLHKLVDVLDLVEGEPLEHAETVSIMEHVEGCGASQHLHCLELA